MHADADRPVLLAVEDDRGLQKQMRWSLDPFELVCAEDHESAIAALRRHEPAVMTLDLGLPPHTDDTRARTPLYQRQKLAL